MPSNPLRRQLSTVLAAFAIVLASGCALGSSVPAGDPQSAGTEAVVGTVVGGQLAAYRSPAAARPFLVLGRTTAFGSPTVVLVRAVRRDWLQVLLPNRPNGLSGWVRRSTVTLSKVRYRLRVSLATRQLVVYYDNTELFRTAAAVGAPATPTPTGLFFLTDAVRVPASQPAYGPFALGLSGHSPVLARFGDGDAQIALHGTASPGLLGRAVSHGCVRISNSQISRLARLLPLGTPVQIDAG
jgi:lipoprotein-anchoring transpeptidase ErfK/SrfK